MKDVYMKNEEQLYNFEKAFKEAGKIKELVGENAEKEDYEIADKIIEEEKGGKTDKKYEKVRFIFPKIFKEFFGREILSDLDRLFIKSYELSDKSPRDENYVRQYLTLNAQTEIVVDKMRKIFDEKTKNYDFLNRNYADLQHELLKSIDSFNTSSLGSEKEMYKAITSKIYIFFTEWVTGINLHKMSQLPEKTKETIFHFHLDRETKARNSKSDEDMVNFQANSLSSKFFNHINNYLVLRDMYREKMGTISIEKVNDLKESADDMYLEILELIEELNYKEPIFQADPNNCSILYYSFDKKLKHEINAPLYHVIASPDNIKLDDIEIIEDKIPDGTKSVLLKINAPNTIHFKISSSSENLLSKYGQSLKPFFNYQDCEDVYEYMRYNAFKELKKKLEQTKKLFIHEKQEIEREVISIQKKGFDIVSIKDKEQLEKLQTPLMHKVAERLGVKLNENEVILSYNHPLAKEIAKRKKEEIKSEKNKNLLKGFNTNIPYLNLIEVKKAFKRLGYQYEHSKGKHPKIILPNGNKVPLPESRKEKGCVALGTLNNVLEILKIDSHNFYIAYYNIQEKLNKNRI